MSEHDRLWIALLVVIFSLGGLISLLAFRLDRALGKINRLDAVLAQLLTNLGYPKKGNSP